LAMCCRPSHSLSISRRRSPPHRCPRPLPPWQESAGWPASLIPSPRCPARSLASSAGDWVRSPVPALAVVLWRTRCSDGGAGRQAPAARASRVLRRMPPPVAPPSSHAESTQQVTTAVNCWLYRAVLVSGTVLVLEDSRPLSDKAEGVFFSRILM